MSEDEEFNEKGSLLQNNKSIEYIQRRLFSKKDRLKVFFNSKEKTEHLDWVVFDMENKNIFFTSDSKDECENWISGKNFIVYSTSKDIVGLDSTDVQEPYSQRSNKKKPNIFIILFILIIIIIIYFFD